MRLSTEQVQAIRQAAMTWLCHCEPPFRHCERGAAIHAFHVNALTRRDFRAGYVRHNRADLGKAQHYEPTQCRHRKPCPSLGIRRTRL